MGLEKLITACVLTAFLAAFTGQLPRLIMTFRKAQFQLLQDSKASKWPKAMLLPIKR